MTNQLQPPSGPEPAQDQPVPVIPMTALPILAPPSDGDDASPRLLPLDSVSLPDDISADSLLDNARSQQQHQHHLHLHLHPPARSHLHLHAHAAHSHSSADDSKLAPQDGDGDDNTAARVHSRSQDDIDIDVDDASDHASLRPRQDQVIVPVDTDADGVSDSYVTHVIQTVSLVQIVDPAGNPLDTQTVYAPPATVVVDPASGNTVAISALGSSVTASAPDASSSAATENDTAPPTESPSPVTLSMTASSSSVFYPTDSSSLPVTSPPLPPTTALPPVAIPLNSTSIHSSLNSTSLLSFSVLSQSGSATTITFSGSTTESSESFFSTTTDSSYSSIDTTTGTYSIENYGDATDGGSAPTDSPNGGSESSGEGGGDLTPQEKQIVGGVVGGIAGAAFIIVLLLLAMRYKKKRQHVQEIIGPGAASRALSPGSGSRGPDGGSGSPAPMVERSSAFGVSAALASLTGKANRDSSQAPASAEGERGFYRVAGRKLPSVLHAGGDGYTDPRESVMSGASSYYRGSDGFEPAAGGKHHLALGAPMRPVSGAPIMRSGPARTAMTEQNPFADPPSPPAVPPPPRDPVGRSLGSQDGSRGSGSRFQEGI